MKAKQKKRAVPGLRGSKETVVNAPRPRPPAPHKKKAPVPCRAFERRPGPKLDAPWEAAVKNVSGCMIVNMTKEALSRGCAGPRVSLTRFERQLAVRAHGLARHFKRAYPGGHESGCFCREEMLLASMAARTAEKTGRWTKEDLFEALVLEFKAYTRQLKSAVN